LTRSQCLVSGGARHLALHGLLEAEHRCLADVDQSATGSVQIQNDVIVAHRRTPNRTPPTISRCCAIPKPKPISAIPRQHATKRRKNTSSGTRFSNTPVRSLRSPHSSLSLPNVACAPGGGGTRS